MLKNMNEEGDKIKLNLMRRVNKKSENKKNQNLQYALKSKWEDWENETRCAIRESNPGLNDENVEWYHYTNGA